MKLLFDLTPLAYKEGTFVHGGGEYCRRVLLAVLERLPSSNIDLHFCVYTDGIIDPTLRQEIAERHLELHELSSKYELPALAQKLNCQRFFSALPYRLRDVSIPVDESFITIHGLRQIEMPFDSHQWYYTAGTRERLRLVKQRLKKDSYLQFRSQQFQELLSTHKSARIVVPSEHTKYSLAGLVDKNVLPRVVVLYSPHAPEMQDLEPTPPVQGVNRQGYILLLSADRWIKNAFRALKALDRLYTQDPELEMKTLVLGDSGGLFGKKLRNSQKFVFHGYVNERELHSLYQHASALMYPSLNEGFGYPPVEAMCYGTPVLASAISSIPEICGSAPLYFSPYNESEMICRVTEFLDTDRAELSVKSRNRYAEVRARQVNDLNTLVDMLLT